MSESVTDELKSEILSEMLEKGERSGLSSLMSMNRFDVTVSLDRGLMLTWKIKFLSEIDLNIDNQWAVLCQAPGEVEIPSSANHDPEFEVDEPKQEFPSFGFDVRSNRIAGDIIFHVFLEYVPQGTLRKFRFRNFLPYSLVVNKACLLREIPVEEMLIRFPSGHMIFQ